MAQGPRLRDPSIEQKMKELSNVYNAYTRTKGEIKVMWCDKWYALVKEIAVEIKQMRQESGTEDTF